MQSKQEQDFFLSGLIELLPVKQRRIRKKGSNPEFHDFSYQYFVNIPKEDGCKKEFVCVQAFCAIFGITRSRIRTIRKSIAVKGNIYLCLQMFTACCKRYHVLCIQKLSFFQ